MKGIDFTPDMHRALREGRKFMTRRVVKCPNGHPYPDEWQEHGRLVKCSDGWVWSYGHDENDNPIDYPLTPKYKVGDRVFVREAWATVELVYNWEVTYALDEVVDLEGERPRSAHPGLYGAGIGPRNSKILYKSDYDECDTVEERGFKWRSPRFMPAWASRTILEITGVRVERVNEISAEDCYAEGLGYLNPDSALRIGNRHATANAEFIRERFMNLWDSIYGPGSWLRNDWVFVYEFKVVSE